MEDIKLFVEENGGILTGFLAVLIIFGGVSFINNPSSQWWVLPLGIIIIAVVVLLFINARAFIKFILSLFITAFFSAYAFQLGVIVSGDTLGSVWMGVTWLNLFLLISVSYARESNQSRWNAIIITQVLSFLFFYVLASFFNYKVSLGMGEVLTLLSFVLIYYFPLKNIMNIPNMPEEQMSKAFKNNLERTCSENGWEYKILEKNSSIVVWGEFREGFSSAVVVLPIKMKQKFGVIGRRRQHLSYRGKSINPWLSKTINTMLPYWKLRGVNALPVLCDLDKRNGGEMKLIGVKVQDRRKPFPFVVAPFSKRCLEHVVREYSHLMVPITPKQIRALEELGESAEKNSSRTEVSDPH